MTLQGMALQGMTLQKIALPQFVDHVEAVNQGGDLVSRLVHRHQPVDCFGKRNRTWIVALQNGLGHRVSQGARSRWVPFGLIAVEERLG